MLKANSSLGANSSVSVDTNPRINRVEAYVQRDFDGRIQRGCLLRSGSSMSRLVLRFLGRHIDRPLERASVDEAISGADGNK